MFHVTITAYVAIGIIVSLITMRVFPPMEGFRPKLQVRLLGTLIFTLLWPVLVILAAWYLGVGYLRGLSDTRKSVPVSVGFDVAHQIPAPKPRPR